MRFLLLIIFTGLYAFGAISLPGSHDEIVWWYPLTGMVIVTIIIEWPHKGEPWP